jgi:hypothetical protein
MKNPEFPNWEEIGIQLLHSTQLVIIEAMLWMEVPVSPRLLEHLSPDSGIKLGHFAYHCKSLAKLGILEKVGSVPRRGAAENYYYFATDSDRDDSFYYFLPDAD